MTDVVCAGCGSSQREGAPFCAACGREFPRTGRPVVESAPPPMGQVQQTAAARGASAGLPPLVESRPPITTEVEVYTATQIPAGGSVPPQLAAPYAGVGKRFVAWLIDGAIAGALAGTVALVGVSTAGVPSGLEAVTPEQAQQVGAALTRVYLLTGLVALGYQVGMGIWEALTGKTVGNLVMGVRTVSVEAREPIGLVRELLRLLVLAAGTLVCGVGQIAVLLSPLWDKGGKVQGWHDKAARSVVLDVRAPQVVVATGLAPATAGPRAPGQPALRAPAPSAPASSAPAPMAQAPQQMPAPAPAAPDPWAFPQRPVSAPAGNGLITGVPGSTPGAPPSAEPAQPVQQPAQPVQPVQPVQQPAAPPVRRPDLPPQQHPESRPTRPVAFPRDGAVPAASPAPPRPSVPAEQVAWDATRMQAPDLVPAAVVTVALELESGARHIIDGPALVGRNPQAAEGSGVILVRVEDPTRSVSKNHAELGVDPAGLWLTDRGSTNGTVVSAPGRSPQVAEPGARVRVPMGSTIHVGDRRIVVHRHEPQA